MAEEDYYGINEDGQIKRTDTYTDVIPTIPPP